MAVLHPCAHPRCPALVERGHARCPAHEAQRAAEVVREYDSRRPSSHARGYDGNWRRLRDAHLATHPLCVDCGRTAEQVGRPHHVDHVQAHRGNDALRLDPRNLATRCHPCHSRKTATVDGGMGNGKASANPVDGVCVSFDAPVANRGFGRSRARAAVAFGGSDR